MHLIYYMLGILLGRGAPQKFTLCNLFMCREYEKEIYDFPPHKSVSLHDIRHIPCHRSIQLYQNTSVQNKFAALIHKSVY